MRLFRSKKRIALSPLPGEFAGDDPAQVIFDQRTRLSVETNHWKLFAFVLALVAGAAILTRQPAPSVVKAYGVSADTGGRPVVRLLAAYQPDDQAIRASLKETIERWYTIEPILTGQVSTSRMKRNIEAVKAQMVENATGQFTDWLGNDGPFRQIAENPKLIREVKVLTVSLLQDSTAVIEFTTTLTSPSSKPETNRYAMTLRYKIVPPSADDAISTNPFGIFLLFFTLQKTSS